MRRGVQFWVGVFVFAGLSACDSSSSSLDSPDIDRAPLYREKFPGTVSGNPDSKLSAVYVLIDDRRASESPYQNGSPETRLGCESIVSEPSKLVSIREELVARIGDQELRFLVEPQRSMTVREMGLEFPFTISCQAYLLFNNQLLHSLESQEIETTEWSDPSPGEIDGSPGEVGRGGRIPL